MGTLCSRDRWRSSSGSLENWLDLDREVLAMQTQTGVPLMASVPVPPEQGSRANREGMEQDTHLTRFGGGSPVPLALFAQGTRTTVANAGRIDDPQAAITLVAVLMWDQHLACRTSQRPIGLKRKVGAGEAARFPGGRSGRRSIPRGRCTGSGW